MRTLLAFILVAGAAAHPLDNTILLPEGHRKSQPEHVWPSDIAKAGDLSGATIKNACWATEEWEDLPANVKGVRFINCNLDNRGKADEEGNQLDATCTRRRFGTWKKADGGDDRVYLLDKGGKRVKPSSDVTNDDAKTSPKPTAIVAEPRP
jgi:hypothetical protein